MNFLISSLIGNSSVPTVLNLPECVAFDVHVPEFTYDRGVDGHCNDPAHTLPYSDEKAYFFKGVLTSTFDKNIAICRHHDVKIVLHCLGETSLKKLATFPRPNPRNPNKEGNITAMKWINDRALLLGLCSGHIVVYDSTPDTFTTGFMFHNGSAVSEIQVHERTVWTMFNDGVLISISSEELLSYVQYKQSSGERQFQFQKLLIQDHTGVTAFLPSLLQPSLIEEKHVGQAQALTVFGNGPVIAYYKINQLQKETSLTGAAIALAGNLGNFIFGNVGRAAAWAWGYRGSAPSPQISTAEPTDQDEDALEQVIRKEAPTLVKYNRALVDEKRRIESISIEPSNRRLAAAADQLGRGLLLDLKIGQVLRMWKGLREARMGWIEYTLPTNAQSTANIHNRAARRVQLYLAILSPQRGMVEIWQMRHGPRVKVVGVHPSAVLITLKPSCDEEVQCYSVAARPKKNNLHLHFDKLTINSTDIQATVADATRAQNDGPEASIAEKIKAFRHLVESRHGRNFGAEVLKHFKRFDEPFSIDAAYQLLDSKKASFDVDFQVYAEIQKHAISVINKKVTNSSDPMKKIMELKEKFNKRQVYTDVYGSVRALYQDSTKSCKDFWTSSAADTSKSDVISPFWSEVREWLQLYDFSLEPAQKQPGHHEGVLPFHSCLSAIDTCTDVLRNNSPLPKEFTLLPQVIDLLGFFFRPLFSNVFAVAELKSCFEKLEWKASKIMQCFALWMFTLPIKELSHATVYGPNESVLERWVSEMTLLSDEDNLYATTDKTELQTPKFPGISVIGQVQEICEHTVKLELALICVKLYGSALDGIAERLANKAHADKSQVAQEWSKSLLQKIRLCLVCNNRMGLHTTSRVTLNEFEHRPGNIYQVLANDQLMNGYAVDIYTIAFINKKPEALIQDMLKAAAQKPSSKITDTDASIPLVTFFPHHCRSDIIACYCLKQLMERGKLRKAVEWLKFVNTLQGHVSAAVALWMWEEHLRVECKNICFEDSDDVHVSIIMLVIEVLHVMEEHAVEGEQEGDGDGDFTAVNALTSEVSDVADWPPSHDKWVSELQESLERKGLNRSAVRLHLCLLQSKIVQEQAGLSLSLISTLFTRPDELCLAGALQKPCEETLQSDNFRLNRKRFLSDALKGIPPSSTHVVYDLAELFAITRKEVHNLHVIALLELNRDEQAEGVLCRCSDDVTTIADIVVQIFKKRACFILKEIEKDKSMSRALSELDGAACEWIRSAKNLPIDSSNDPLPIFGLNFIISTRYMLRIFLKRVKPSSPAYETGGILVSVLEDICRALDQYDCKH